MPVQWGHHSRFSGSSHNRLGNDGLGHRSLPPDLPVKGTTAVVCPAIDPGMRLANLSPMLRAVAGTRIEFDLEVGYPEARARIDPFGLDAAILELVVNAERANASRIKLRNRKVGAHLWILVRDNRDHAALSDDLPWARDFARRSHGQMFSRYSERLGASAALVLPAILTIANHQRPLSGAGIPSKPEEKTDEENRQPVAA